LNIIDSIGKGFQTVNRYWWLILIPVLLDVFLWIGPEASVEHLAQQILEMLEAETADLSSVEGMSEWLGAFRSAVQEVAAQYNGFSALRVGTLGIPSLMTWGGTRLSSPSIYETLWVFFALLINRSDLLTSIPEAAFVDAPVWQYPHQVGWFLSNILLSGVGVLIGSTYLASIARGLSEPKDAWVFWPRVLKLGGRYLLFWLVRTIALVITGIPFLAILLAISALSPGLASLIGTIALGMLTWLSFYGIFFIAALVVNDVSVWRAIWNSLNIVLRNFGPTFMLFLLLNLVGGGLTILWGKLSTGSWWTLVGIVGNAYVGTGLVTASLVFYQDRYAKWRETIAQLLSETGNRAS
jgi:hypothetical protein